MPRARSLFLRDNIQGFAIRRNKNMVELYQGNIPHPVLTFPDKIISYAEEQSFMYAFRNGLCNFGNGSNNTKNILALLDITKKLLEADPTNAYLYFYQAKIFSALTMSYFQEDKTQVAENLILALDALEKAFEQDKEIIKIMHYPGILDETFIEILYNTLSDLSQLEIPIESQVINKTLTFVEEVLELSKDLKLEPKTIIDIRCDVAAILFINNFYDEAIAFVEKALEVKTSNMIETRPIYCILESSYLKKNDIPKALEYFTAEMNLLIPNAKTQPTSLEALAEIYYDHGFYAQSVIIGEQALQYEYESLSQEKIFNLKKQCIASNMQLGYHQKALKIVTETIKEYQEANPQLMDGTLDINQQEPSLLLLEELMHMASFCDMYSKIEDEIQITRKNSEIQEFVNKINRNISSIRKTVQTSTDPIKQEQRTLNKEIEELRQKLPKNKKDSKKKASSSNDASALKENIESETLRKAFDSYEGSGYGIEKDDFIKLCASVEDKSLHLLLDKIIQRNNTCAREKRNEIESEIREFLKENPSQERISREIKEKEERVLELNSLLEKYKEISAKLAEQDIWNAARKKADHLVQNLVSGDMKAAASSANGLANSSGASGSSPILFKLLEQETILSEAKSAEKPAYKLLENIITESTRATKFLPECSYLTIKAEYIIIEAKTLMVMYYKSYPKCKNITQESLMDEMQKTLNKLENSSPIMTVLGIDIKYSLATLYYGTKNYYKASELLIEASLSAQDIETPGSKVKLILIKTLLAEVFRICKQDSYSYKNIKDALVLINEHAKYIDSKKFSKDCIVILGDMLNSYGKQDLLPINNIEILQEIRSLLGDLSPIILSSFIGMMYFVKYETEHEEADRQSSIDELKVVADYYAKGGEIPENIATELHPHSLHIVLARAYADSDRELALKYATDSMQYCFGSKFSIGITNCIIGRLQDDNSMSRIYRGLSYQELKAVMEENPNSSLYDTAAAYLMENSIFFFKHFSKVREDKNDALQKMSSYAACVSLLNKYVTTKPFYIFAITYLECYMNVKEGEAFVAVDHARINVFMKQVDAMIQSSPHVGADVKLALYTQCKRYYEITNDQARIAHCTEKMQELQHVLDVKSCKALVLEIIDNIFKDDAVEVIGAESLQEDQPE